MSLKYKCLLLDHDDTSVDSTPHLHYPAYLDFMKSRPNDHVLSLQEWFEMLWKEGLLPYYRNHLHMTEDEITDCFAQNKEFHKTLEPVHFFKGFIDFLAEYRKRGGIVAIVSFSSENSILSHYKKETDGTYLPDHVFGWNREEPTKSKPYTYPVDWMIEKYNLNKKDILVVDDMSPGLTMAKRAGVDKAGALYGEGHEVLESEMKELCEYVLKSADELRNIVFGVEE
ncbi:Haloacid dehalogenase-like hydrolase domain-containing protein [Entamoeba marina]